MHLRLLSLPFPFPSFFLFLWQFLCDLVSVMALLAGFGPRIPLYCKFHGKIEVWRTVFPWAVINTCVNSETFGHDAGAETKHCWDSLRDPYIPGIKCPLVTFCMPYIERGLTAYPYGARTVVAAGYCCKQDAD